VTTGALGPHVALMNTALVKFTPDLPATRRSTAFAT
jgi:hypothetical protein